MANITLGSLRDLWKAVSDWVTGASGSKPAVRAADIETLIGALNATAVTDPGLSASQIALLKGLLKQLQGTGTGAAPVTLNGRNPKETVLTTTPLAAYAWYYQTWQDAVTLGYQAVGYEVYSDLAMDVILQMSGVQVDYSEEKMLGFRTIPNQRLIIPPIPIVGRYYRIRCGNPKGTAQSSLSIIEYAYPYFVRHPKLLTAVLCDAYPIRDTNVHAFYKSAPDPEYMQDVIARGTGDSTKPILIENTLDQSLNVNIWIGLVNGVDMKVNPTAITVNADSRKVITNQDYPALDVPFRHLFIDIQASALPTTGTVSAWLGFLVG